MNSKERISAQRSVIMGVSALGIFVTHLLIVPQRDTIGHVIKALLIDYSFCGVDIFCALSAFGLTYAFRARPIRSPKDYAAYLLRRVLRIYATYLPVVVLLYLIEHWTLHTLFRRLFLIDHFERSILVLLWYIPAILLFYVIAPGYESLLRRGGHPFLQTAGVFLCTWLLCPILKNVLRTDLYAILTRLPDFAVGFLLAYEDTSGKSVIEKKWERSFLFIAAVGVVVAFLFDTERISFDFPAYNVLANNLMAPGLIVVFGFIGEILEKMRITAWLREIFVYLGSASLEWYCIHETVWEQLNALELDYEKKIIAGLIVTYIGALGLHAVANMLRGWSGSGQKNGSAY